MSNKYTFSITGNFPNQEIAPGNLVEEIRNSNISTELEYINTNDDVCDIWFDGALSSGDENTLNTLVSGHDGIPFVFGEDVFDQDDDESSTTSTSWQQKLSLTVTNIPSGTYEITWYCEYSE